MAGPGASEGGGIWGAATDGRRVCIQTLPTATEKTSLLMQIQGRFCGQLQTLAMTLPKHPVTVANGVVFAGSVASNGPIYAMKANTGRILWSYNTGATVYGGISASYGYIYVGSGYSVDLAKFHPTWTAGTSLYAFCVI